ncbi:MAG TPA: ABC transporter permease [Gemmatimonadales bacterium]|nr:ABC transporter permease [Gemmatimonadales bacterium]
MTQPVIDIRNVTKVFVLGDTETRALDGVTIAVQPGEFVAIMGASGSGNSTLMNILGCLDRPSGGDYFLEGVNVATLGEPALARVRSRRIGFVFQNFNLLARTSALENVALPLFYSSRPGDATLRARQGLVAMGLTGREQNAPNQLSGGQQQRVAIARALINDPAILLADEPTGNLDSKTSEDIMAALRALNRQRGLTVVLVTHEPDMAAYADRIVTMRDGRIVSDVPNVSVAPGAPGAAPQRAATPVAEAEESPAHVVLSFGRMALLAAGRAIARNTMRSALTMLGIFIGVAALIAMVAVGQGAKAAVKAQIEGLGTNLLVVLPGATTASGVRSGFGSASTLQTSDAEAIKKEDTAVADVSYLMRQVAQVQIGNQNWSTSIQGVTPSYLSIRSWAVAQGRPMTDEDMQSAARVALLGQTVLANLFGEHSNPIGATILVKNVPLEVIGVLAAKGQSGFGQDQDDVILIPFSTAERKVLGVTAPSKTDTTTGTVYPPAPNPFGLKPKLTGYVNTIFVQAISTAAVPTALDQVTATLRRRHGIRPGATDDFGVRNMNDVTQAAEGSSQVMAMLLATVASISLLVGGIGIMNILLVSVTERTREIGIRMAIGARRIHVLLQFLVEAILLSAGGGCAGVLMGVVVSKLISVVAHWPTALSPMAIIGAFFFSAAVGVFFGYHPARQASHLNPIEALRYE